MSTRLLERLLYSLYDLRIAAAVLLLLTACTGTLFYLVWLGFVRATEKYRAQLWRVRLLWCVVFSFLAPAAFAALVFRHWRSDGWEGFFLCQTPVLGRAALAFLAVWACGAAVRLRGLVKVRRAEQPFLEACGPVGEREERLLAGICRELGLKRRVRACRSALVLSPSVGGVLLPTIYLGPEEYKEEELRLIFKHELLHIRHGDLLLQRLIQVLRVVYWFVPPLTGEVFLRQAHEVCEEACDEELCGSECARDYQLLLLRIAVGGAETLRQFGLGIARRRSDVLKRVKKINRRESTYLLRRGVAVLLAVVYLTAASSLTAAVAYAAEAGYAAAYRGTEVRTAVPSGTGESGGGQTSSMEVQTLGYDEKYGQVVVYEKNIKKAAGFTLLEGHLPRKEDEVLIDRSQLVGEDGELSIHPGDTIQMSCTVVLKLGEAGKKQNNQRYQWARQENIRRVREATEELQGSERVQALVEESLANPSKVRYPYYQSLSEEEQRKVLTEQTIRTLANSCCKLESKSKEYRKLLGYQDMGLWAQVKGAPQIGTYEEVSVRLRRTCTVAGIVEFSGKLWDSDGVYRPGMYITGRQAAFCEEALSAVYEMYPLLEQYDGTEKKVTFYTQNSAVINWELYPDGQRQTRGFYAASGETICIDVELSSERYEVQVGIVDPEGRKRYMSVWGRAEQDFVPEKSGIYRIYVYNADGQVIRVAGTCAEEKRMAI